MQRRKLENDRHLLDEAVELVGGGGRIPAVQKLAAGLMNLKP